MNEWYHLALVKSGTNLRVFYNGVLEESVTTSYNPRSTTENLFFGSRRSGPTYFHGMIDEIRISSIARYASNFTPVKRFSNDTNTIGLWNFEETTGTIAYDSSGNDLNGTLVGGVEWVNECVDDYTIPDPDPDPVTVFFDDFESGTANWTLTEDWEIGEPYFISEICVITEAYSGNNVMATNLTGNYTDTKIMDAITANPLSLPTSGKITLEFMAYVWTDYEKNPDGTISEWYDGMTVLYKEGANTPVELVITGGNSSLIGSFQAYNPGGTPNYTTKTGVRGHSADNTYSRFSVDISHLSEKTVNLIFRYASDPLVRDTDIGVYIDDVVIIAE